MPSERGWFETVLRLVGKHVEVGTRRDGAVLAGTVTNAMFDSFLIKTAEGNRVVAFADIMYVDPKEGAGTPGR